MRDDHAYCACQSSTYTVRRIFRASKNCWFADIAGMKSQSNSVHAMWMSSSRCTTCTRPHRDQLFLYWAKGLGSWHVRLLVYSPIRAMKLPATLLSSTMFGVRSYMDRDGRSLTMTICYALMLMIVCLRGSLGQVTINWVIQEREARRLGLESKFGTY